MRELVLITVIALNIAFMGSIAHGSSLCNEMGYEEAAELIECQEKARFGVEDFIVDLLSKE